MIIGKTRTNQPVESSKEFDDKVKYLPLPATSEQGGKVLAVNSGGTGYQLKDPATVNSVDMANIVDADGHNRFIEGNIATEEIEGVTWAYARWSLSGTHLMCVLAGTIEDETALTSGTTLARATIPSWVGAKIYPVFVGNIEIKELELWNSSYEHQTGSCFFSKEDNTTLRFFVSAITLTSTKSFRLQFDLLIDNE